MQRPNVVMITCHDLGRYLGCYGNRTVETTHLDAFAADAVRFERAFCSAPQCSPSRASLFTGKYPHSNGMMGLTNVGGWDLHPNEIHIAQRLREVGYKTALVGIYHETLSDPKERLGMDVSVTGYWKGEKVTDHALQLLDSIEEPGRPFFLEVGYFEPHRVKSDRRIESDYMGFVGDYIESDSSKGTAIPPYLFDRERAREEIAELQGAVRYLDQQVGRLLSALKERGLEENTLVLFTTDHGLALPRAKCSLYDPGIETALMLRLPSHGWRGGRTVDHLISNIDIVPTLLDLLHIPGDKAIQGRSFAALLDGKPYEPRDCIYAEMTYHDYYDPRRCLRTAKHKLIVNFSGAPYFMDPSQSWRRRTDPVVPEHPALAYHPLLELYDLAADPYELTNVIDMLPYRMVQEQLLQSLFNWMKSTDDPLLGGAVESPFHRHAVDLLQNLERNFKVQ